MWTLTHRIKINNNVKNHKSFISSCHLTKLVNDFTEFENFTIFCNPTRHNKEGVLRKITWKERSYYMSHSIAEIEHHLYEICSQVKCYFRKLLLCSTISPVVNLLNYKILAEIVLKWQCNYVLKVVKNCIKFIFLSVTLICKSHLHVYNEARKVKKEHLCLAY